MLFKTRFQSLMQQLHCKPENSKYSKKYLKSKMTVS